MLKIGVSSGNVTLNVNKFDETISIYRVKRVCVSMEKCSKLFVDQFDFKILLALTYVTSFKGYHFHIRELIKTTHTNTKKGK